MDLDLDDGEDTSNWNQSGSTLSPGAKEWKQEAQTWDLLRRILASRYSDPAVPNRPSRSSISRGGHTSLWQDFLESDPIITERKAVLHWLQSSASNGPDIDDLVKELQQNADRGDIVAHGWIHTRTAIKQRKRLLGTPHPLDVSTPDVAQRHLSSLKAPLVTHLDPDATSRQSRKLQPQDEYFERATWLGCFELLRRGYSAEAIREWCVERTEGWRSVSMSPLSLAPHDGGPSPETTPEALALWRRTCLSIARQPDVDDYERAVYGILSGDIATVERVSTTWDDFVFAHYNAVFRGQFDTFILSKCSPEEAASLSQSFVPLDTAQQSGPGALEKRLLRSLEQSKSTMAEAREPHKVFQGAVLASELEQYFFDQGLVLGQDANQEVESKLIPMPGLSSSSSLNSGRFYTLKDHRGLRIVAHAYIILSQLEEAWPRRGNAVASSEPSRALVQQNVVSAYISLLRVSEAPDLIPLYCSTLREDRKYDTLCRNLIHVTDEAVRVRCINLIGRSGLNAPKFARSIASMYLDAVLTEDPGRPATNQLRILAHGPANIKYGRPVKPDFFGDDPDRIGKSHELLIRSIEWLTYVDEAWPDVLAIVTRAHRHFLSRSYFGQPRLGRDSVSDSTTEYMHLNAARKLCWRVPFMGILQRRGLEPAEEVDGLQPPGLEFWVQQLALMGSSGASAVQVAADARGLRDLEYLVRALDTMETLASLEELSRE
jgi:nuclear pore complex protein Nup107